MDTAITLATIPAILALVNFLKSFGVEGKWSALAAVFLAVGVYLAQVYAPGELYQTLSGGILLGLGAAGLYDTTRPPGPAAGE